MAARAGTGGHGREGFEKNEQKTSQSGLSGMIQGKQTVTQQNMGNGWTRRSGSAGHQQGVFSIGDLLTCRLNRFQGPT